MKKNTVSFYRKKAKNKKGFTLVEIIVVIVIIAILTAILIPSLTRYFDMSKEKSDLGQLGMLNRVTQAYRIDQISADPFLEEANSSEDLMDILVEDNIFDKPLSASLPGASFQWSFNEEKWVYLKEDGTKTILHFAQFTQEDLDAYPISKGASYHRNSTGIYSKYGLLFVPNSKEFYTIKNIAKLGASSNMEKPNQGGYGIVFETTLNEKNEDTGYILQFDRGHKNGKLIIRKRNNGEEVYNPVLEIGDFNDPSEKQIYSKHIPLTDDVQWWTSSHEININVSNSTNPNKKILSISIDGKIILAPSDEYEIHAAEGEGKFTGIRSWGADTEYEKISIE